MTNVIPSEEYKRVRREYRARFLFIGSLALLLCALFTAAALIPAEITLRTLAPAPNPAGAAPGNTAADTTAIKNSQGLLTAVSSLSATSSLNAIGDALSARPPGISIVEISYDISGHVITLSGTAANPEDVNAYRMALQKNPEFESVSVPVQALLGTQNGAFTMTLGGNF